MVARGARLRDGGTKTKEPLLGDKGDAEDEDCDVAGGKGVALVAALTRAQVKAALLGGKCRSVGLAYARNKQRGAQRQHELELLDGVFGVVLHAACCLRFDNRIHLLAEHGDKAQCCGEGESVAVGDVQLLDAGVCEVVELGDHEHQNERQRHAQKTKAGLGARDETGVGYKSKKRLAFSHEGGLKHKHDQGDGDKQPQQLEQAIDYARVGAQSECECEQADEHRVALG